MKSGFSPNFHFILPRSQHSVRIFWEASRTERWLKDYNGQTYWFSGSPRSFFKNSNWPAWLCFSVGYGIQNMVSADPKQSTELGYRPYRQYYLSLGY